MSIVTSSKQNLASKEIENSNLDKSQKPTTKQSNLPNQKTKKSKSKGFFSSTVEELKKVEWPSLKYVLRWSFTILVFITIFSLFLSSFDHIFANFIKFSVCLSPQDSTNPLNQCLSEFGNNLTFQN